MRLRDAVESRMRAVVRSTCRGIETLRRWRRKTGKRPKTWMLNSVRLKTELVDGRREARTVEAMRAALVEREEGNGGARGWDAAVPEESVDLFSTGRPVFFVGARLR